MNQDNAPITKENLRAVLCEEWLNILREELGENAPATIGDIRQMVREAICENPSVLVSDTASTMSETDVNAVAHRIVDIMRESGVTEAVQEAVAAVSSGESVGDRRIGILGGEEVVYNAGGERQIKFVAVGKSDKSASEESLSQRLGDISALMARGNRANKPGT